MKRARFDSERCNALGRVMGGVLETIASDGKSALGPFTDEVRTSTADVQFRLAWSVEEQTEADRLVQLRYAWRGYAAVRESGEPLFEQAPSPDGSTLLAHRAGMLVGTITLGVDGLLAEQANRAIVDAIKRGGRRVIELRRLAVRDTVDSRAVLAELFRAAYCIGRLVHRATDALIEVNPRHAGFYSRVFGFVRLGDPWICARVNAPAVLMHLDASKLDLRLRLARPQGLGAQAA